MVKPLLRLLCSGGLSTGEGSILLKEEAGIITLLKLPVMFTDIASAGMETASCLGKNCRGGK